MLLKFVLFYINIFQHLLQIMSDLSEEGAVILEYKYCDTTVLDDEHNVIKTANSRFSCPAHEEANTKIVYHKKKLKNFDASNLPPCKTELRVQLLRVLYI
ncbi:hypothetical protein TSAR_004625 [Trichomalopsis sarcophagae]|uniref:Uncharacterized protein n=1 Tax=Trichomalopsis sarcophagae TaxID=543379 RepID=A0A232EFR4_9HYME|nr:hypothetical protein TSAR_004625 [Trichomalopsis sarcophagae]